MRIAFVITELYPGGAERCLTELAVFLAERGHDVHVIQLWSPPPTRRCQLVSQLQESGVHVESLHWNHWSQSIRAICALRKRIESLAPEIVQSFLFHANVAAALACRRMEVPLIGGVRVAEQGRLRRWCQRVAARRMHQLVCVSQSVAERCRAGGIPDQKLRVITNGIRLARVDEQGGPEISWDQLGVPASARVVLFVGRLDPQKGILEVVRKADQLLGPLPEHHLVLIGDGSERQAIQRHIQTSLPTGVRNRVHVAGWQEWPIRWMRMAELLLLPSRYEGMPNAVLEAMAVGLPVVSFDVEGIRELIGDGWSSAAQCVPSGDMEGLFRAVQQLAKNPELRTRLGQANRRRVEANFDLDEKLREYEQLYLNLLDGRIGHHG